MTSRTLFAAVLIRALLPLASFAGEVPKIGIDSNYALEMEARGKSWQNPAGAVDPFQSLAQAGCQEARIRLWTGDEGLNGLTYATETARRARRAGL